MKKFTALFLAFIFALIPLTAYAQNAAPAETQIMMGDVTNDKKVSAADARAVLRIAASLDSKDGVSMLAVDADANGKITAADARLILRVAAKQTSFTCGFDAEGNLNAANIIKSGVYSMNLTITDSNEDLPIFIASSGNNFCLKYTGSLDSGDSFTVSDMGILFLNGKTYAITTMNGAKMAVTEESLALLFSEDDDIFNDFADLITMVNFTDGLITDDMGIPKKITENGSECFVYNYTAFEQDFTLIADSYGRITRISSDDGALDLTVDSVSCDIDSDIFDLTSYALI